LIVLLGSLLRLSDLDEGTIGHIEIYVPGIDLPYDLSDPRPRFTPYEILIGMLVEMEPHPPGYYFLMLAWTKLFGTGIVALRLPSVIFGVASILLIFVLGLIERDKWTGLAAATMLAIHGHQIFWSQIAKMYGMGTFFGLLSTVLLLLILRERKQRLHLKLLYVGATVIGLSTTTFLWPVFFVHIIWTLLINIRDRVLFSHVLRLQVLAFILGSPFLSMAIYQSRRESYLDPNPLSGLVQFLQFGFVIESEQVAVLSGTAGAGILIATLAVFLAAVGIADRSTRRDGLTESHLPPLAVDIGIAFAGVFALLLILRFAKFTEGMGDFHRTSLVVISSAIPILLGVTAILLSRYERSLLRLVGNLNRVATLRQWRGPASLITYLAIVPVGLIAGITPFIPLFDSRTVLLFTPFWLILAAKGYVSLIHLSKRWIILLPLLAMIFWGSIVSYQEIPRHPNDYKALANQWMPKILENDLIFVQRHWATTPIFYYLKGQDYNFVGGDYVRMVSQNPDSRVWVLSFTDLKNPVEMTVALRDYVPHEKLEALRIEATMYTNRPAELISGIQPK
jgi:4-amino-4-deoxy-L-arabinose transferase-like glycosyltransferase